MHVFVLKNMLEQLNKNVMFLEENIIFFYRFNI